MWIQNEAHTAADQLCLSLASLESLFLRLILSFLIFLFSSTVLLLLRLPFFEGDTAFACRGDSKSIFDSDPLAAAADNGLDSAMTRTAVLF